MASAAPDALTGKVAVIKKSSRSEIGWAIGAGRTGAIIGPYLGGVLIDLQWPTAVNFICHSACHRCVCSVCDKITGTNRSKRFNEQITTLVCRTDGKSDYCLPVGDAGPDHYTARDSPVSRPLKSNRISSANSAEDP